jgi:predicted CoA-binding protein
VASNYETFFENGSYAVIGHTAKRGFPRLTYQGLKKLNKIVFPVDPSAAEIDGDPAFDDLSALPQQVDAVVLEVPKEETEQWVARAAEAGVKDIWIHQQTDTPEALGLAEQHGINLRKGSCAVMYVTPGLTYHSIHKWIMKLAGKY